MSQKKKQCGGNPANKTVPHTPPARTYPLELFAATIAADLVSSLRADQMWMAIDAGKYVSNPLPEDQRPVFSVAVAQGVHEGHKRVLVGLKGLAQAMPRAIQALEEELPREEKWPVWVQIGRTLCDADCAPFNLDWFRREVAHNLALAWYTRVTESARDNGDQTGYFVLLPDHAYTESKRDRAWPV